jgi:Chaperone for flagella basal body P-ring formation
MQGRLAIGCGIGVLTLSVSVAAQSAAIHLAIVAAKQPSGDGEVLREIDDAANGCRWLLERDTEHPGSPGRMVLIAGCVQGLRSDAAKIDGATTLAASVIRVGDRVVLEAHTAAMDVQLEAVALTPAAVGSEFVARMKLSGQVLRAVAVARGRARWLGIR